MEITIDRLSPKGRGRTQIDGKTVDVIGAIPGDRVLIEMGKKRKKAVQAHIVELLEASSERIAMQCPHASICGGCTLQQMAYSAQVRRKQEQILTFFGSLSEEVLPLIQCQSPWNYRNKMEYSFWENLGGERALGLVHAGFAGKTFQVKNCHIATPWMSEAALQIRSWWDASSLAAYYEPKDSGSLRRFLVREGIHTGEKMAMLTVSGNSSYALNRAQIESYCKALGGDVSLFLQIQQIKKGVPTQFFEMHLQGKDHIVEKLHVGGKAYSCKLSPTSFFQPNTKMAEKLYEEALSLADLQGDEVVWDLYCGTGILSLLFASRAKEAIGVELNPHALFDAEANKEANGVQNVRYIQGDVAKIIPTLKKPDLICLDPPRAGLGAKAIAHVQSVSPKKIVYISCNPKTQAEDCKAFCNAGYRIKAMRAVDQFPHTIHVENIAILQR